jgi:energy-dependent translational throttle protein EttA
MLISHGRWSSEWIATHMLAFEGDGKAAWFDGNIS